VARDRQRAKQRKARRAQNPASAPRDAPSDVPAAWEHSSADIDEIENAIVQGAGGEPAEQELDTAQQISDDDSGGGPEDLTDEDFAELEDEVDEYEARGEGRAPADTDEDAELEREALGSSPAARGEVAAPTPGAPTKKGIGRFVAFLRACWAELQRVQWPDRRQVAQATAVVIGFVIVAGLYLGVADWVAKKVVNVII
jgi:preprotein translocase subunit SecE